MKFKIINIIITNYKNIRNFTLNFPNCQWIFLTGSHKNTFILQALAIGLNGLDDLKSNIIKQLLNTKVTIIFYNNNILQTNTFENNNLNNRFNNFVCYGPSRLNLNYTNNTELNSINNIFTTDSLLLNIETYLKSWINSKVEIEQIYYKSIISILKKILINYYTDIIIEPINNCDKNIYYIEKFSNNKLTFIELPNSFKCIIAMITDMLIRFMNLGANILEPQNISGIVIIDEFDLHLTYKLQIQFIKFLTNIFPKIQFIISITNISNDILNLKNSVTFF